MGSRLFRGMIIVAAMMVAALFTMTLGPQLEAWAFPPLEMDLTRVVRTQNAIRFYMTGKVLRDCQATGVVAAWHWADERLVMAITPIGPQQEGGTTGVGETYDRGPLEVRVPASAYSIDIRLFVTVDFKCWTPWIVSVTTAVVHLSEVPLEAPVAPPPQAVEP